MIPGRLSHESPPTDPKILLRRDARARRDGLDASWRREASVRVARLALGLPEFAAAQRISTYMSIGSEVETRDLLDGILRVKRAVALPLVNPETGRLEHRWITRMEEGYFRTGLYGIPEPDPALCPDTASISEIDLCFVPGLAFDSVGHRLGMGGGHYDRLFASSSGGRKFGLGFSSQIVGRLPDQPHDIRMDGVITETGVLRF